MTRAGLYSKAMNTSRDSREAGAIRLARLVAVRKRPEPELGLREQFAELESGVRKQRRAVGGLWETWEGALRGTGADQQLVERTSIVGMSGGVLTVRVQDAATKFALDRLLRSGGELAVVRLSGVALKRVKTVM